MDIGVGLATPWDADEHDFPPFPHDPAGIQYGLLVTGTFDNQCDRASDACVVKGRFVECAADASLLSQVSAAFGSFGWSGEAVKVLNGLLEESGFSVINEGIRAMWNPDEESLEKCIEYGKEIAKGA